MPSTTMARWRRAAGSIRTASDIAEGRQPIGAGLCHPPDMLGRHIAPAAERFRPLDGRRRGAQIGGQPEPTKQVLERQNWTRAQIFEPDANIAIAQAAACPARG